MERYEVKKLIFRTLFGSIFEAIDTETQNMVAIKHSFTKLIQYRISMNGIKVLEDPLRETEVLQALPSHPHIIKVLDKFLSDDNQHHYVVYEFIPGGELFQWISDHCYHIRTYSERYHKIAREIFRQLTSALQHMHEHHTAHLDVSSENILLVSNISADADEKLDTIHIKLCDFGQARSYTPDQGLTEWKGDVKFGKLGTTPPEMHNDCPMWHPEKADVFSAGVVLFTMLTGSAPFHVAMHSDPYYDVIDRKKKLAALLKMQNLHIDSNAIDLMEHMLECNPNKRYSLNDVVQHKWMAQADVCIV